MKKNVVIVCFAVVILGIISVSTGFAAEAKRIKVIYIEPYCMYPKSSAAALGVIAALSLLASQLTLSISSGCFCCRKGPKPPHFKWLIALICFVISWFTFVISTILFLTGAALNDHRNSNQDIYLEDGQCKVVRSGVFIVASIFSILTFVLGIINYLILNSAKNLDTTVWGNPVSQPNIAMAQPPQFPPPRPQ